MTFHRPGSQVVERDSDVAVITLVGEHDLSTSAALRREVAAASETSQAVVVNLGIADFIDRRSSTCSYEHTRFWETGSRSRWRRHSMCIGCST
jgi:hypothetical protein